QFGTKIRKLNLRHIFPKPETGPVSVDIDNQFDYRLTELYSTMVTRRYAINPRRGERRVGLVFPGYFADIVATMSRISHKFIQPDWARQHRGPPPSRSAARPPHHAGDGGPAHSLRIARGARFLGVCQYRLICWRRQ
uniref:hypothetical protein n=1 Tax=Mycolicibacterium hippocampi TaxID=659824 RepID=UPI0021F343E9